MVLHPWNIHSLTFPITWPGAVQSGTWGFNTLLAILHFLRSEEHHICSSIRLLEYIYIQSLKKKKKKFYSRLIKNILGFITSWLLKFANIFYLIYSSYVLKLCWYIYSSYVLNLCWYNLSLGMVCNYLLIFRLNSLYFFCCSHNLLLVTNINSIYFFLVFILFPINCSTFLCYNSNSSNASYYNYVY